MGIKNAFILAGIVLTTGLARAQSNEKKKVVKNDSITAIQDAVKKSASYVAKPADLVAERQERFNAARTTKNVRVSPKSAFIDANMSDNQRDIGVKQKIYNENDPEFLKKMESQLSHWMEQERIGEGRGASPDYTPRNRTLDKYLESAERTKKSLEENPKAKEFYKDRYTEIMEFMPKQEAFVKDRIVLGDKTVGNLYDYVQSLQKPKVDHSPKN